MGKKEKVVAIATTTKIFLYLFGMLSWWWWWCTRRGAKICTNECYWTHHSASKSNNSNINKNINNSNSSSNAAFWCWQYHHHNHQLFSCMDPFWLDAKTKQYWQQSSWLKSVCEWGGESSSAIEKKRENFNSMLKYSSSENAQKENWWWEPFGMHSILMSVLTIEFQQKQLLLSLLFLFLFFHSATEKQLHILHNICTRNNSILLMLTIPFIGKTHYYYCWVRCVKNCSLFRKRGLPVPVM